jgi:tRNA-dihydrouridine synthase B
MQIDALRLDNPFILAPLAGYTDLAFRRLCREYGAALCFSEMISSHGLVRGQQKTIEMLATMEAERPVAFQLFGADPDVMAEAAAILSDLPFDMIDINMGCPVKKVVKRGAGAALMMEPQIAARIIGKVCRRSSVPVSVKIRSGPTHDSINAPTFAKMAEEAGARAVIVHGRTWSQGFSGRADWQVIARVKEAVSIPVIGNGDIATYQDGLAMMAATGCDGSMIGRAALGNPWVFRPEGPPASLVTRIAATQRYLQLIAEHHEPERILARIKNLTGRFFKGIPAGSAVRRRIYGVKTFSELQALLQSLQS